MNTTTNNPFNPPKANVADIGAADDGAVQEPRLWTSKGRIGRLRYLGWVTVSSLIVMLVVGLAAGLTFGSGASPAIVGVAYAVSVIVAGVFGILALIQRSHDMGWSGWTVLIAMFVPFAALVWLFKKGTPGTNQFGPKPTPNTTGVKIAALAFPVLIFGIGILAAVAMPAYMSYVKRAQAAQSQSGAYAIPGEDGAAAREPAAEPTAQEPAAEQPATEQPAAEQPAEATTGQPPAPAGTSGTSTQ